MQGAAQTVTGRVYALKNVRVFYSKKGRLRFISHLDMNRFFTRILRKSALPIWYTEGFNPHPYFAFAIPLSLGFESDYEIVDFRLTEDDYPLNKVKEILKAIMPNGIEIIDVREPVMKTGEITCASFEIGFDSEQQAQMFYNFLSKDTIPIVKKTKRGNLKEIDAKEKIIAKDYKNGEQKVFLTLPAGNDNLNPSLLTQAFFEENNTEKGNVTYTRTALYVEKGEKFY